ncbi:MAG TPA: sigma-70 family RNA polymerase sigma factor [Limnochordia bacterium]|nr:sigma-70 family RNA polymerase sigma factor [Limnochordia bacterium]
MERIRHLISQAQEGNPQAHSELVEANLPLVHSIARRFLERGLEYDDLLQIGSLGLVKAIRDFDLDYDVKFSTYAVPKIMGEIKQHLRRTSTLQVARSTKKLASDALQAKDKLGQALGRSPTISEIAAELEVDPEDVVYAFDAVSPVYSLQTRIVQGDNEAPEFQDLVASSGSHESFMLKQALERLTQEERTIVLLRYYAEKSQSEVARHLGISQAQISRKEAQIMRQLRHEL